VLLYSETPNVHMHTLKLAVIELDNLKGRKFGVDEFRNVIGGRLYKLDPFRYQLIDIPLKMHHPMWRENCEVDLDYHLRHTARRLEHLASLRLPVAGLSVLEVGAGIGDHSHYFLDRGCRVTITEARTENLAHIKAYYVGGDARLLDLEFPHRLEGAPFDLVHCYGLLYHLAKPKEALAYMSENATQMLFLETCVSFGEEDAINLTRELQQSVTQAYSGVGCRPTRPWLFRELRNLFEHVYVRRCGSCPEPPIS
jgi:hypothetical protein